MNIYLLQREDVDWDEIEGHVIIAPDEGSARKLAAPKAWGEGKDTWLSDQMSKCELIGVSDRNTPEIILTSSRPG